MEKDRIVILPGICDGHGREGKKRLIEEVGGIKESNRQGLILDCLCNGQMYGCMILLKWLRLEFK